MNDPWETPIRLVANTLLVVIIGAFSAIVAVGMSQ
jgi:hypothetical protein